MKLHKCQSKRHCVYTELDPADLELGVLQEAKKRFRELREKDDRLKETWAVWSRAIDELRAIESDLNLGEMRKTREKVRAWDMIYVRLTKMALEHEAKACLDQVRAELEGEGK